YMIFRWGLSVALGIFSNVWIAGAASALIASFIVAPQLFTNLVSKMKTKSGLPVKTNTGTPDAAGGDVCGRRRRTRPAAQHCGPPLLSRSAGAATPATTRTAPRSMPKRRIQSPSAPATEPTEPETGDESTEEGGQGEKSGATADLGVE